MNLVRVILDTAVRSIALGVLTEVVAATYAAKTPDDDGLGTGLMAMFTLVCAAALWGVWDGFHRGPLQLCVTWVATGFLVAIGTTVYHHVQYDELSTLLDDLFSGLLFWAGLVAVPAIVGGIAQSSTRRSPADRAV